MVFAATPPWDGTLAKYYVNASDFCYKLLKSMDLEEGAMVGPLAVAISIGQTAGSLASKTVVVMGCGPIGLLCQAVAKQYGASKVIGLDVVVSRMELAKSYGADETYMPSRATPGTDPIEHAQETRWAGRLISKGSIRYLAGAYPAAIDLIARRKVDVKALITHRFKFEDSEQAFELVKEGRSDVFKVMIEGVQ
jgi:D-xylulose reductase